MKKTLLLTLSLTAAAIVAFGQAAILKTTTKRGITIHIDYTAPSQWGLTSKTEVDTYTYYNLSRETKRLCLVSDCDSICFRIQNDTTIYFDIVLNDTSHYPTAISVVSSPVFPNTLPLTEKLFFLSQFWSEVKYNFVFFDEIDFSWDSLYKAAIAEVIDSKDDYHYYKILERFTASLKDGHTELYNKSPWGFMDYVPILGKFFGKDFYITSVRKGYDEILPPGSKIIEVDGLPLDEHLQKNIYPYINSKSPSRIRMLAASNLLSSRPIWDSLRLRYITPKNETRYHVFARNGETTRTPEDEYVGYLPQRSYEAHRLTWHKNKIAVLTVNTFYSNNLPRLDSLMDQACDAQGLIIDLRYNGGGSTFEAYRVLERLSPHNYFLTYGYQSRINDGVRRANGNWIEEYHDYYADKAYRTVLPDTIYIPDTVRKFKMPVLVLISEFTFSAAEDFLIMLYEMEKRPLLMGSPTGGSTGSPLVIATGMIGESLPDGSFARLCTRRVIFPYSHKPFHWIEPDIRVEYDSVEEYLLGKDKVMETALEKIRRMKK